MFEVYDDDNRDFITVYKKHYYPKKYSRVLKFTPPFNYEPPSNPINGPFKQHLNYSKKIKNKLIDDDNKSEDIIEYLQKIKKEKPHLKICLPNENIIRKEQKKNWKTVYKIDYSNPFDDEEELEKIILPDDWIIPQTVQQRSFRDPKLLMPKNHSAMMGMIKPVDNLTPNYKQRNILNIKTGESEYTSTIATTGEKIIKEKITQEPVKPRRIYQQEIDDCDEILNNIKSPLISQVF
ncbi:uncharacterized protein LOC122858613 [Aphidius gifuensis]|uniref:uncharacterized protein LOC122858613 n=1 Tax=Aphidius gifuensis TaxID=684658 RepID=UPI001CDBA33A|nr:uncharacterized protein LOC122858613 [Aphidius gifuensis]XP_044017531.1 uncharacterized protein LOC122858613 [Aphidius gifuensis]